jgi:hypothetical protein
MKTKLAVLLPLLAFSLLLIACGCTESRSNLASGGSGAYAAPLDGCDPELGCPGGDDGGVEEPSPALAPVAVTMCNNSPIALPFRVGGGPTPSMATVLLADVVLQPDECRKTSLSGNVGSPVTIGASASVANDYSNWAWRKVDHMVMGPTNCVIKYQRDEYNAPNISIACTP